MTGDAPRTKEDQPGRLTKNEVLGDSGAMRREKLSIESTLMECRRRVGRWGKWAGVLSRGKLHGRMYSLNWDYLIRKGQPLANNFWRDFYAWY